MSLSKCANCSQMHVRHQMCQNCGYYRGRVVVDMTAKLAKREAKNKKKRDEEAKVGKK